MGTKSIEEYCTYVKEVIVSRPIVEWSLPFSHFEIGDCHMSC
jgi:hypothetical protein